MKKLLFIFIFPLLVSAQATIESSAKNNWQYNLETAIKLAENQDKNILIYFTGSDWCPPCKMLKIDLFDTAEFKQASENYILVYVDMPRNQALLSLTQMKHNKEVVAKHNRKGVFPLLKVLNASGKSLDEYSGYAMNGDIKWHLQLLNKYK